MKNFRTFDLAVEFYHLMDELKLSRHEQEQCQRAALSIVLNLAEGRGRPTVKDQVRFFYIALGSVRECQALLIINDLQTSRYWFSLDKLAASLYKLIKHAA